MLKHSSASLLAQGWFWVRETGLPRWRWRCLVGEAMLRLSLARLLIAAVPLRLWLRMLGEPVKSGSGVGEADAETRLIASAINRGANRLPFATKCLPRAVALHAMLSLRHKPSRLVIAVLDRSKLDAAEELHAWVESRGEIVIGKLDFPFHPIVIFGKN